MHVTAYASASEFLQAAGAWLEREEALNGLMLGLSARLAGQDKPSDPQPVMMTASGAAGLAAACLQTSPQRPVVLYAPGVGSPANEQDAAALDALVEAMQADGHEVCQCVGPSSASLALADLWTKRTGGTFKLLMGQRIYELREVTAPTGVSGTARYAGPGDLDLVVDWQHRFAADIGELGHAPASREMVREQYVAGRHTLLWEDDGQPVSMAIATRPTRRGIAIGGVYTPPQCRRRGYASACVAELSHRLLDAGREFCCLYTDASNATSNRIYRKIGYKLLAESSHYAFVEETHRESGDHPG